MSKSDLTAERLRELLDYNQETGIFTWLSNTGRAKKGQIAGTPSNDGYINIMISNYLYRAHRLAWLYMTGTWPQDGIDHINGDRSENRYANLREATPSENLQNRKRPQSNNTSGFLGVAFRRNGWRARITVDGKEIYLGDYPTRKLAYEAYLSAKRIHHPFSTL